MPTYGYECTDCDHEFEVFQSIKDNPLTTCEACGGALRKRIYPVGIAFKGPGFYVNDYARAPESKAEGKSEPKSEAKTEPKPPGDAAAAPPVAASSAEAPKAAPAACV